MSAKGRTKPPLTLAHDISRGILQLVIASINALLLVIAM
jgi:hypothetical protein